MAVEFSQLRDTARLLRQAPDKYVSRLLIASVLSIPDCELGKVVGTCYFTLKKIDDALDGDRFDVADPLEHALDIKDQVLSGSFHSKQLNLAKAIDYLEAKAKPGDDPRSDFAASIDSMIFDYERALKRRPQTTKELRLYYHDTFFPVVNILLVGIGSRLRAKDIPELSFAQGEIYSIRDFPEDWQRGVLNVPIEVLNAAGLSTNSSSEEVGSSRVVRDFFAGELARGKDNLTSLRNKLNQSGEWKTAKTCHLLARPMEKYIAQTAPSLTAPIS
ncbi:squalene/phytoene synthase family protein [Patescibacteria group bacterium]|nr:squalene/phytoene synthase family protein [Patescibacteria group bacterium]